MSLQQFFTLRQFYIDIAFPDLDQVDQGRADV